MLLKIATPSDGETEFQLRVLKDEGVGLLTTRSQRSYLILDSLDFWYDLIQTTHPKKKKCKCGNEWFHVQLEYLLRTDKTDIENVLVTATCTDCQKFSKVMSVDFKYSPTLHFLNQPITFCKTPDIKYKFKELNCYWEHKDLARFLEFMITDSGLHAYCYYGKHPDYIRKFEAVSYERAIEITTINHRYLDFYFSPVEISDLSKMIDSDTDTGVFIKEDLWRRNELIHLSSPFHILGYGLLYYIHYCAQYLDKGEVANKSPEFEKKTIQLENWLKETFVTGRGKNCFDGEEAYKRVMAKL